jgi:hypothetical protein
LACRRQRTIVRLVAIEFAAFTADHRLTGRLPLADDRLSDMLNSVARVVIRGAVTEAIDDGYTEAGDVMVGCGDLWIVAASGRRGIESRRRRTSTRRVQAGLGRYVVEGDLHLPVEVGRPAPSGDLEELLAGRDLLVPLTDATLTFDRAGHSTAETHETVLVNRARIEWIETTGETAAADEWTSQLIGVEAPRTPAVAARDRAGWRGIRGLVGR